MPKGVPLEPGQQHLAVHVEDHPLEYATFEGEIPKGQYGAGTVEIWDNGTYELVEEKTDGGLTVRLHGERLDGTWALVPAKLSGDPKNWLIIQGKRARRTRRSLQAASTNRCWPPWPSSSEARAGWLFEVKWDGYRAIGRVAGGEATLTSRNGNDLTERFRSGREGAGRRRSRHPTASSTARSARSTSTAARASRRCSRAGREADLCLLRLRSPRGRRRAADRPAADWAAETARAVARPQQSQTVRSRRPSTTGRRCSRRPRSQGSKA